jgi:hypothetical protein
MAYQEQTLAGILVHHKVYQSDASAVPLRAWAACWDSLVRGACGAGILRTRPDEAKGCPPVSTVRRVGTEIQRADERRLCAKKERLHIPREFRCVIRPVRSFHVANYSLLAFGGRLGPSNPRRDSHCLATGTTCLKGSRSQNATSL